MNIQIDPNTMVIIAGAVSLLTLLVMFIAISKIVALGKSIQRLSEQIPGTSGVTAKELGAELGGSIESSFQKYMPQPDKVATAIASAVEASLKNTTSGIESLNKKMLDSQSSVLDKWAAHEKSSASGLEKIASAINSTVEKSVTGASTSVETLHKKLLESQNAVLDKWVSHEKNSTSGLESIRKALEAATLQFGTGLTGGSQKMQSSLEDGSKKLSETLSAVSAKLEASLKDHSDKTIKASDLLAAQLEKIVTLEKEITKLLHLQDATDVTLKSVAASEEFKSLVKSLRDHLQASDSLLREVGKPRMIRLVEQDA